MLQPTSSYCFASIIPKAFLSPLFVLVLMFSWLFAVWPQGIITATAAAAEPDLVLAGFTAPAGAVTQQQISVSWTVQNQGTGEAAGLGSWIDQPYLSTDTVCCTGILPLRRGYGAPQ